MNEKTNIDSLGSAQTNLDTNIVPLGERSWRKIIEYIEAVGDEAETPYLEVKSSLDFNSKSGIAKVAKFLLGTANRLPHEASRHFNGYAVLVIGAQKGSSLGIPRGVEAHDLENILRPYLGTQFPIFEFGRVTINSQNEVLFIIAQPPQDGQSIFPCHKDFQGEKKQDTLENGAVYVRGASNTRRAHAGEILALVERARSEGKPPINLDIDILGPVHKVKPIEDILEQFYEKEKIEFNNHKDSTSAKNNPSSSFARMSSAGILGFPKSLSPRERANALEKWLKDKPENIKRGREYILGVRLSGTGIRVISHNRFITKPHLILIFRDCELVDYLEEDDLNYSKIVKPIISDQYPHEVFDVSSLSNFTPVGYPVHWQNEERGAKILLTPDSFRPNEPWETDLDDYVLISKDPNAKSIQVTWTLTEEHNNEETTGEFQVSTAELISIKELFYNPTKKL
jgi:hypothetical protein